MLLIAQSCKTWRFNYRWYERLRSLLIGRGHDQGKSKEQFLVSYKFRAFLYRFSTGSVPTHGNQAHSGHFMFFLETSFLPSTAPGSKRTALIPSPYSGRIYYHNILSRATIGFSDTCCSANCLFANTRSSSKSQPPWPLS